MAAPGGRHNGRVVLMEVVDLKHGTTHYYYADDLPCAAKMYTVLSVIGSIIATPLILLCCIPTIKSIKKTQKLVEEGDIEAARTEFRTSFRCRLAAWIWCTISPVLLVLGIIFITLAALGIFSSR